MEELVDVVQTRNALGIKAERGALFPPNDPTGRPYTSMIGTAISTAGCPR